MLANSENSTHGIELQSSNCFIRKVASISAFALYAGFIGFSEPTWAADNGKLKIFILAGQSNMEGYGKVEYGGNPNTPCTQPFCSRDPNILSGLGSLRSMVVKNPGTYSYLIDTSKTVTYTEKSNPSVTRTYPSWATRSDVWVSYWDSTNGSASGTVQRRNGALSVGFGVANIVPDDLYIGPEFGFGHIVGNALGDPVLLIKAAWGGKSLQADFRPPSSSGATGPFYTEIINRVKLVLSNIKTYYPAYNGAGYEIVGFGWHQGWNDRVCSQCVAEYETNLSNLIRDVRTELGLPKLPFVIANTGMALANNDPQALALIAAQANVSNPSLHPEFAGTVSTVDTRPFDYGAINSPSGLCFHWCYNGESYFHIGESMGNAMLKLVTNTSTVPTGPAGYAKCANEGGTCAVPSASQVAYGANGTFIYATTSGAGTVPCTNTVFLKDPVPGVQKACYYKQTQTPPPPPSGGPAGYAKCANEGGTCAVPSASFVAYGANGTFIYATTSGAGTVPCTNTVFLKDPVPGVQKACYFKIR